VIVRFLQFKKLLKGLIGNANVLGKLCDNWRDLRRYDEYLYFLNIDVFCIDLSFCRLI